MTRNARPNFIELPARDIARAKAFYQSVFGWTLTDFGPTYACTMTGDVDVGLQADPEEASIAPLPVICVTDLEAALAAVLASGGTIVRPIFAFPGGRRFQFLDPSGNELAVMAPAAASGV
jgi:predicted enzyme related to lactoylglutathione lyase